MPKYLAYALLAIIGFMLISLAQFVFVIMPPEINLPQTPENFKLPRQDMSFLTTDNVRLSGWFIKSPRATRALILLHSYPFNKADLLPVARNLYPDFSLLLFDLRSFGASEGRYTTFGIKERYDVSAAAQFLAEHGYENIGLFGYSLGGAVGLIATAREPLIDAVASYASFADIITVGKESFRGLSVLADPFIDLFSVFARPLFGAWPTTLSPEHAAENITVPVFIIHAKTDEEIPFNHALRLQDALRENPEAQFYFTETGSHGELPSDIGQRLTEFFNSSL